MGCNTCKQKKENKKTTNKNKENETIDINFFPKSVQEGGLDNGSFVFKVIAFFVVIVSLPKSLPKVSNFFKNLFMGGLNRYAKFKHDREVKKRKQQFEKNRGYEENSELVEVSDIEENNDETSEEFVDINIYEKKNNKVKK
jgi:hypothetical protein